MDKETLNRGIKNYKAMSKQALEDFLNGLNSGQRKKILKQDNIKVWCDIFGVEYSIDNE